MADRGSGIVDRGWKVLETEDGGSHLKRYSRLSTSKEHKNEMATATVTGRPGTIIKNKTYLRLSFAEAKKVT